MEQPQEPAPASATHAEAPAGAAEHAASEQDAAAAAAAERPHSAPLPLSSLLLSPEPPATEQKSKVFEVGARVIAQASFDSQYHPAEVVDRRGEGEEVKYYVHFVDYNKRVDEWLAASKVSSSLFSPSTGGEHRPSGGFGSSHGLSVMARRPCAPASTPLGGLASPTLFSPGPEGALLSPLAGGGTAGPAGGDRKLTRNLKRRYDEMHHIARPVEELAPLEQSLEREHEEKTKVKNIMAIELGRHEMDTWYYAPYPPEYAREHTLLMCEFCLKYFRKRKTLSCHKLSCGCRAPPGTEIYRHPARPGLPPLSMWEVDGKKAHQYCQNLCLLAKLFLDHKTLYYDVDPFLFYVLTERDEQGHHLVGYFSKEKATQEEFNLACILTLPPYQRRGYGRFLIAFSYELSKVEGRIGTPERPLSDLGAVSYRSYWTRTVLEALRDGKGGASIKDISLRTAITQADVVSTLQGLGLLKWWRGQHIIAVTPRLVEDHLRVTGAQGGDKGAKALEVDPSKLSWTPYGKLARPRPL